MLTISDIKTGTILQREYENNHVGYMIVTSIESGTINAHATDPIKYNPFLSGMHMSINITQLNEQQYTLYNQSPEAQANVQHERNVAFSKARNDWMS